MRLTVIIRYTALLIILLVLVLPFVAFAINAFAFGWFFPQLIPTEWTLQAWERVIAPNSRVLEAFINSTMLALGVTLASIIIGLPAARVLGLYDFRGKRVVEFLIIAPTMVPPIAVSMGLNINFLRLGLANTLFGVGLVHLVPVMPYVVLVLAGVFANYDITYEQQARTLGARPAAIFRYVTLPAIFPGIVVGGLFAFLISWSQYILTFLIGGGQVITMPVLLFTTIPGGNNPDIAVQSLLFIGPALLILLLTARYLTGQSAAVGGFGRV